MALRGNNTIVEEIERVTAPWADRYNAWPAGDPDVSSNSDQFGQLRLTRSRGIVRVFFQHQGKWTELGQTPVSGEIWIGISLVAPQQDWQQQDVSAAVDNFVLKAPNADCPAGSNP